MANMTITEKGAATLRRMMLRSMVLPPETCQPANSKAGRLRLKIKWPIYSPAPTAFKQSHSVRRGTYITIGILNQGHPTAVSQPHENVLLVPHENVLLRSQAGTVENGTLLMTQ